jgi:hypothetical protein
MEVISLINGECSLRHSCVVLISKIVSLFFRMSKVNVSIVLLYGTISDNRRVFCRKKQKNSLLCVDIFAGVSLNLNYDIFSRLIRIEESIIKS